MQRKYPPTYDCDSLSAMFVTEPYNALDISVYQKFANLDKGYTENTLGTGYYQCFCNLYKTNKDYKSFVKGLSDYDSTLCNKYIAYAQTTAASSTIISLAVTIVNMVIREINICLISRVGYHTGSE